MRTIPSRLAMVVAALSVPVSLFSQVITSPLTGTVTGSLGATIPGATVTIEDPSHGVSRTWTTNVTGELFGNGCTGRKLSPH